MDHSLFLVKQFLIENCCELFLPWIGTLIHPSFPNLLHIFSYFFHLSHWSSIILAIVFLIIHELSLQFHVFTFHNYENKYRRLVYQALSDQPISNFILANHKPPFNGRLFKSTFKARNHALMSPFMRKIIFRQGNGFCRICNRDRQDISCRMHAKYWQVIIPKDMMQ
jgi:hypothetical protein